TGGGEPTVYPKFKEVLERTIELGLKFALVSNGVKIDENLAPLVAKAEWVRVSLDSSSESTYVQIRRIHRSHWMKAQNAVRLLKVNGAPVVGIGFVVTPDNWQEIFEAAKLAKDLGADNFRISAQFSNEDEKLFAGFHAEAASIAKQAESLSDSRFTVYNRFS